MSIDQSNGHPFSIMYSQKLLAIYRQISVPAFLLADKSQNSIHIIYRRSLI